MGKISLIEMMIIVLILGILIAVAIPVFGSAADNARIKAGLQEGIEELPIVPEEATKVIKQKYKTIFYIDDDCFIVWNTGEGLRGCNKSES